MTIKMTFAELLKGLLGHPVELARIGLGDVIDAHKVNVAANLQTVEYLAPPRFLPTSSPRLAVGDERVAERLEQRTVDRVAA